MFLTSDGSDRSAQHATDMIKGQGADEDNGYHAAVGQLWRS